MQNHDAAGKGDNAVRCYSAFGTDFPGRLVERSAGAREERVVRPRRTRTRGLVAIREKGKRKREE